MRSRDNGAYVTFDPIGLLVQPGTKIRWVVEADVHTTTAYHPANDSHSLRIPTSAQPWASDYLVNPGDRFEVVLTVPGVYDYFCTPHEMAGMVGGSSSVNRAVPALCRSTISKGMLRRLPGRKYRKPARDRFPAIEQIMAKKIVKSS
jgi:plastocyanin